MEDKVIAKNSKGEITEFYLGWCWYNDLIEIISILDGVDHLICDHNKLTSLPNLPKHLLHLRCEKNDIKQLPDLRECNSLEKVICDIQCFEPYMLEMKDTHFEFYC